MSKMKVNRIENTATTAGGLDIDSSGRIFAGGTVATPSTTSADDIVIAGSGNIGLTINSTNSAESSIFFADGTSGSSQYMGQVNYYHNVDALTFASAGSERLRIDSSGRLLVGTSSALTGSNSANGILTIKGYPGGATSAAIFNLARGLNSASVSSGHTLGRIVFADQQAGEYALIEGECDGTPGTNDYPGRLVFSTCADGASSPTERMRIGSSGIIHFGSTAVTHPTYFFAPDSGGGTFVKDTNSTDSRTAFIFRISGTQVGSITTSGSATAYNTSSDYRLKENVVDIADGITRVKQLQPKRFNFIADADTTVDGFLAHEAQVVVPEAVTGEKDGEDMQGIDQSKLVPLLTAALQEAIAKIETLEQRLTDAGIA